MEPIPGASGEAEAATDALADMVPTFAELLAPSALAIVDVDEDDFCDRT